MLSNLLKTSIHDYKVYAAILPMVVLRSKSIHDGETFPSFARWRRDPAACGQPGMFRMYSSARGVIRTSAGRKCRQYEPPVKMSVGGLINKIRERLFGQASFAGALR